jgi:hypothetical protein
MFHILWRAISPFVDAVTRKKMLFLMTSDKNAMHALAVRCVPAPPSLLTDNGPLSWGSNKGEDKYNDKYESKGNIITKVNVNGIIPRLCSSLW